VIEDYVSISISPVAVKLTKGY